MNKNKWLLISATCLGFSALAQEPVPQLTPLRVKASRMPADPSETGASYTALSAKDLEPHGNLSLGTFLQTVPGIHFASSGPRGSVNNLLMRGSTQKYTLVRVDGVNVSDPSASQIAPQIEHILVGDIEKIEILRGSQSSLYGGQAVAGVIEITTKKTDPGNTTSLQVEGGSYQTYSGKAKTSVRSEKGFLSLSTEMFSSDGFSTADENNGNSEDDGYEIITLGLQGDYQASENLLLKGSARHSNHEIEFDAFTFGVGPVDDNGSNLTKGDQTQVAAGGELVTMEGRQEHQLLLSYFRTNRDTQGEFPASFTGERLEADYLLGHEISSSLSLLLGVNAIGESADTSAELDDANEIYGVFLQWDSKPFQDLYLSFSARNDEHSEFGSHATWKSTLAYTPRHNTKIRGSYGTGFRAPSLFELFDSQFGNPDLDPETSDSWDLGIDQEFGKDQATFSVTYFNLEITDQIDFTFPQGYVQISGESLRRGVELSLSGKIGKHAQVTTSYTHMIDAESTSGAPLLRVPEHDLSVVSHYSREEWTLSGILRFISGVQDLNNDPEGPETAELDAYWVLGCRVSYELRPGKILFVRLENIFDEQYQEVAGYGTADASAYLGLQLKY